MDYVVGSVAALITGNVTPNRPKYTKRALTPIKHQPSPNVTPKSEFVDDRSIFLSPTMQKKKAIVKKSPKRIFQNQDLDVTNDGELSDSTSGPKVEKVKKHLKDDLETVKDLDSSVSSEKSPKKKRDKTATKEKPEEIAAAVESSPKKQKKQRNSVSEAGEDSVVVANGSEKENDEETKTEATVSVNKKKKNRKRKKSQSKKPVEESAANIEDKDDSPSAISKIVPESSNDQPRTGKKKQNKKKKSNKLANNVEDTKTDSTKDVSQGNPEQTDEPMEEDEAQTKPEKKSKKNKKDPNYVNPNAITDKDSDSEHESDNEIESENEEANKAVLEENLEDQKSSDEEDEAKDDKKSQNPKKEVNKPSDESYVMDPDEVKKTLFVGNVPFSGKCKKEIKKIFSKYGDINTIRIRTIPVKDARVTPKLAVIKNELHPERTTVNVYVKFEKEVSVAEALCENNTVLNNCHLRVTRADTTGSEHDPRLAIYVGNIPFGLEDEGLRAKFEKCGEIESVRIVRDKKTNAGKGFGYVNFTSKDAVELALELPEEDRTIKNRIMRVSRCSQNPQRGRKPEGQNRGGFQNRGSFQSRGGQDSSYRGGSQGRGGYQGRGGSQGRGGFQGRGGSRGGFQGRGGGRGSFQGRGGSRGVSQGRGGFQGRGGQGQSMDRGPRNWQENGGNEESQGAFRRLQNKRKNETQDGNAEKTQPPKEKKPRKEFVGVTAEKKKKNKFDKGDKKKRALSEILTKAKV